MHGLLFGVQMDWNNENFLFYSLFYLYYRSHFLLARGTFGIIHLKHADLFNILVNFSFIDIVLANIFFRNGRYDWKVKEAGTHQLFSAPMVFF